VSAVPTKDRHVLLQSFGHRFVSYRGHVVLDSIEELWGRARVDFFPRAWTGLWHEGEHPALATCEDWTSSSPARVGVCGPHHECPCSEELPLLCVCLGYQ